ncbi:MAG: tetratricopeptide repeat protein [Gammaproteobacteria bacterium]|nr:tetratricopeptide repeat protein [Gammaproteobacteria bacterium]
MAERIFRQVIVESPADPRAWNLLGKLLHQYGHSKDALPLLRKAAAISRQAAHQFDLGSLLVELKDYAGACECFRTILKQQPKHLASRYHLGHTLYLAGRLAEAEAAFRRAIKDHPDQAANIYSALGVVLHSQERTDDAIAAMQKAVALRPDYLDGHVNLAEALRQQGRIDEAVAEFRKAIALAPQRGSLWHQLADSVRYADPEDPDIAAMKAALEHPGINDHDRMYLAFALAKAYDDCREADLAFPFMELANRLKRTTFGYDPERDRRMFDSIKTRFTAELFAQPPKSPPATAIRPVFIVGMPRSGTSLVEQILSCHPKVQARGERHDLQWSIERVLRESGLDEKNTLATIPTEVLQKIASAYLDGMGADENRPWLTNKLPFNFLYIGWVRLLFPDAPIVHCRRDPLDTCLSIYQRLFPSLDGFAYDQAELGRYYRAYTDLMQHWETIFPGRIYEVEYESLVANQKPETRRLLDYCGLDWDDSCLNFHEKRRIVSTASFEQVRRPLYSDSVRRADAYRRHLGTLLENLGPIARNDSR